MILPAVLETDSKKQIQRMEELVRYSKIIHTDIMDGKFVKASNLNVLKALTRYQSPVDLELHLMVKEPARLFSDIRKIKKVKRVVLQVESDWKPAFVKYKKYYRMGIGWRTETSIRNIVDCHCEALRSNLRMFKKTSGDRHTRPDAASGLARDDRFLFDFILLLSVNPGAQGNPFQSAVYRRVREVKEIFPNILIEIDGGMNMLRIQKLSHLGAGDFVVGSFLQRGSIPAKMKRLREVSS